MQALLTLKNDSTLALLDIISVLFWMHSLWHCGEVLWPALTASVSDLMNLAERRSVS